jgi:hypothetical protein
MKKRMFRRALTRLALAAAMLWAAELRAGAPDGRFVATGTAGELQDSVTGLIWQSPDDGQKYAWSGAAPNAQTHCVAPWRLPTAYELFTLVDVTATVPPALDPLFIRAAPVFYWTSDAVAGSSSGDLWIVDFNDGSVVAESPASTDLVRCVR